MADQNRALIEQGLSQGQAPDIVQLAQALQNQQAQGAQRPPAGFAGRTPGTGVGIIDLFTRGRRADEAREIAAGQVPATFAASGVDPGAGIEGRAQAVQQLLSNPSTRAQGLVELGNMQAAQGINMTATERSIQQETLAQAQLKTNMDLLTAQRASGLGMSPSDLTSTAGMLFDDRQREIAPYTDRLGSYDQLMSVIDQETGPATVAVLFKFIKSMDDSVVRTSEGELLTSSVGPVRDLANQLNKLVGGGIFDEDTRNDIKETATQLARQTFATADRINTDHDKRAAAFSRQFQTPALIELSRGTGFDPGRVFDQSGNPVTPPPGGSPDEPALLPGLERVE